MKAAWLSILVLGAVALGVYTRYFHQAEPEAEVFSEADTPPRELNNPEQGTRVSPFSVEVADAIEDSMGALAPQSDPQSGASVNNPLASTSQPGSIPSWHEPLDEAQLQAMLARLRSSESLVAQLVDELRQETDPVKKRRLARLLGELGGEQALLIASELVFSGDEQSRSLGMEVLKQIQPQSDHARDIVSNMLATEVEPTVLKQTLSALSDSGDVDADSRGYLADQVAWLTEHADDGVRSVSLDILSRWSDGSHTDTFVRALDDASEHVRSSAAYALAKTGDNSQMSIERLFATLRNSNEPISVKRASAYALTTMQLTPYQQTELADLDRKMRTNSGR